MTQTVTITGAENLDEHKDFLKKAGLKQGVDPVKRSESGQSTWEAGANFVSQVVHFRSLNLCNLCPDWRNPED
jgi:hypothetical protein